jgi:hypothetical protein
MIIGGWNGCVEFRRVVSAKDDVEAHKFQGFSVCKFKGEKSITVLRSLLKSIGHADRHSARHGKSRRSLLTPTAPQGFLR